MNNENLKPFKKGEQRARDCAIKGNKKKQNVQTIICFSVVRWE